MLLCATPCKERRIGLKIRGPERVVGVQVPPGTRQSATYRTPSKWPKKKSKMVSGHFGGRLKPESRALHIGAREPCRITSFLPGLKLGELVLEVFEFSSRLC